jgi:uncharacterized protein YkwD
MRTTLPLVLVTLIVMLTASAAALADGAADQVAARAFAAVNAVRARHGLQALQPLPTLAKLALEHSRRMAQSNILSHTEPDGRTFVERMQAANLDFREVAENIAMNSGTADPAATAVAGWLQSEGHRMNILTPGFTHAGMGVWVIDDRYYFTQIFLAPR